MSLFYQSLKGEGEGNLGRGLIRRNECCESWLGGWKMDAIVHRLGFYGKGVCMN